MPALLHRAFHDGINLGFLFIGQIELFGDARTAFHAGAMFTGGRMVGGVLRPQRGAAGQQAAYSEGGD